MDLVSTTALMEYMDMLYTRLTLATAGLDGLHWWVEVHPPDMLPDGRYLVEEDQGKVGFVTIRGRTKNKVLAYRADFMAVEKGHRAGTEVLETVVDHHIDTFIRSIAA